MQIHQWQDYSQSLWMFGGNSKVKKPENLACTPNDDLIKIKLINGSVLTLALTLAWFTVTASKSQRVHAR